MRTRGRAGEPEALLLDAALESIPYGFCVWSPTFKLVMWNRHYLDIYHFPAERVRRGMALEEMVELSSSMGNYPGQSVSDFYEAYTGDLLANRHGERATEHELLADGRTIRYPSLGTISGDWGGGWHLGERALWFAARAADGRGAQAIGVRLQHRGDLGAGGLGPQGGVVVRQGVEVDGQPRGHGVQPWIAHRRLSARRSGRGRAPGCRTWSGPR